MKPRYYVVRVKYFKDGTEKCSELMGYDSLIKAEAKFHNNLATDMNDETLAGSLCTIVEKAQGTTSAILLKNYCSWSRDELIEDINTEGAVV